MLGMVSQAEPVACPAGLGYLGRHPYSIDRSEFQKYATLGKKDFNAIEYLLRKGHRQLEMYSSPGIRNIR